MLPELPHVSLWLGEPTRTPQHSNHPQDITYSRRGPWTHQSAKRQCGSKALCDHSVPVEPQWCVKWPAWSRHQVCYTVKVQNLRNTHVWLLKMDRSPGHYVCIPLKITSTCLLCTVISLHSAIFKCITHINCICPLFLIPASLCQPLLSSNARPPSLMSYVCLLIISAPHRGENDICLSGSGFFHLIGQSPSIISANDVIPFFIMAFKLHCV